MSTLYRPSLLRLLLVFCSWLVLSPVISGEAHALIGDSEKRFGLDGSVRTLIFVLDQERRDPFSEGLDPDALSQTILRLTAIGRPKDFVSYEVHWVQSLTMATLDLGGGEDIFFGNAGALRYRVLDASWDVHDDRRSTSTAFLDRFNAKLSLGWGDITVGRQAITFGKAYFWNPLDVFFPFDATQFDREYKPGVDALRWDIPLGLFSGINLVGAPGPRLGIAPRGNTGNDPWDASWYGSALLGRIFTNVQGWDLAFQAGKIFGGWQLGAGMVGDLGPVQLRCEIAELLALESDVLPLPLRGRLLEDNLVAVVGMGHRFENSLSLDVEYLYNGAGDPDDLNAALIRTQFGSSLQMSRNLVGLVARYEFMPIVVGQLAAICSLSDASVRVQPIVTVSLSDEMELLLGSSVNFGPGPEDSSAAFPELRSEFGTSPNSLFLEWKYYF